MDVTAQSGIRPAQLNNMEVLGYKFVGCDASGQQRFREIYRNGDNWYSWVYTSTTAGDVGSVRGPYKLIETI